MHRSLSSKLLRAPLFSFALVATACDPAPSGSQGGEDTPAEQGPGEQNPSEQAPSDQPEQESGQDEAESPDASPSQEPSEEPSEGSEKSDEPDPEPSEDSEKSDEPDSEPSEDEPEKSDEDPEKSDEPEDEPEDEPDEEPEKSKEQNPGDCGNIKWGDKWAIGEVVPLSAVVGMRDTNGDQILDGGTSKFDMCDLHRSKKRCAIVTRGHRR